MMNNYFVVSFQMSLIVKQVAKFRDEIKDREITLDDQMKWKFLSQRILIYNDTIVKRHKFLMKIVDDIGDVMPTRLLLPLPVPLSV